MKPPEEFIKYLQTHLAVWEALQPRFFEQGDWAFLNRKPRLVKRVDREARVLIGSAWYGMENLLWLPDLGQLVALLQQEWSDWENRLEIWILKETAGNKGAKAVLAPKSLYLGPIESSEWEWEPEIACTALWAKVKGVEGDD